MSEKFEKYEKKFPVFMFGKYKDNRIIDVIIKDPKYVQWLLDRQDLNAKLKVLILKIWNEQREGKKEKKPTKKEMEEDEESDGFLD
jgi:hypothetical protein